MRQSRRPSLGSAINAAAGALQQHLLMQQKKVSESVADANGTGPANDGMPTDNFTGIVYSGNPHETVPRRLLVDDRLSPLERNTWQVFRLLINGDGVTAFPTYDQLRPYLGSSPGKSASRETVAKALTVLRLTRWLSLGRRVRDSINGRVQGNVYILHDEPVGCAEAMEIDRDYMALIANSLEHANKTVQQVAELAFNEFATVPHLPGNALPTRLEVIEERWQQQGWQAGHTTISPPQPTELGIRTQQNSGSQSQSSESELRESGRKANQIPQSSDSEIMVLGQPLGLVRNPNSYSTYTNTETDVLKNTVLREAPADGLQLPNGFIQLTAEQQQRALAAIKCVDAGIRQSLLNQWQARLQAQKIRNPFGYLLSCVQLALKGDFNAGWQAPGAVNPAAIPANPPSSATTLSVDKSPLSPYEQSSPPPVHERTTTTLAEGRALMQSIRQQVRPRGNHQ